MTTIKHTGKLIMSKTTMNNFECVRRAHKVGKQRTVARGKIFSQFCGPSLPLISFVYLKNVTTHKIQQSETATS